MRTCRSHQIATVAIVLLLVSVLFHAPVQAVVPPVADPAQQCEIAPATGDNAAAQIQAMQQQINQLQAQITKTDAAAPADTIAKLKNYSIQVKNLPIGSYRDRCFACLIMPDEDGERILMCTCPVANKFARLSLNLTLCAAQEDISLCGGILRCGACKVTKQNQSGLPPFLGSNETDSEKIDKILLKKP